MSVSAQLQQLRQTAEAAEKIATSPWSRIDETGIGHAECDHPCIGEMRRTEHADYVAAFSPDVVLRLLDVAERATEVIEWVPPDDMPMPELRKAMARLEDA